MKSLLVLSGKLPPLSTLTLQLHLRDIFSLRLGARTYREILAERLEAVRSDYDFLWLADADFSGAKISEVTAELSAALPKWRNYRNIVLYPASLHVRDEKELVHLLRKLALGDAAAWVQGSIAVFPAAALDNGELQDRVLGERDDQLNLSFAGEILNLDDMQDLFSYWRTGTAARVFNQFEAQGPYLVKGSRQAPKLRHEYDYLSRLPAALRPFFPAVGEARERGELYEYEVEFVPRFDVSRIFIHQALSEKTFDRFLRQLDAYFALCPKQSVGREAFAAMMHKMFVEKLRARSEQLTQTAEGRQVITFIDPLFPSGWKAMIDDLGARLERSIAKMKDSELALAHGDLCFSNILYDAHSGFLKFIDPRGGPALPLLYDVAKLSHSALGGYDLICNGLASLRVKTDLKMDLHFGPAEEGLRRLRRPFLEWLARHGWNLSLVRLCESSLFMSMLPLHLDRPSHAVMQAMAGLAAFEEGCTDVH